MFLFSSFITFFSYYLFLGGGTGGGEVMGNYKPNGCFKCLLSPIKTGSFLHVSSVIIHESVFIILKIIGFK